jgi:tetratricopeptide (TPR) repeat protein
MEAEEAYRRALDLSKTLCDRYPDEPAYREELADSHNNLAVLLMATDRRDQAEKALVEARELWQRLAQDAPNPDKPEPYRVGRCLNM